MNPSPNHAPSLLSLSLHTPSLQQVYDDDVVLHFTDGGNRYAHAHAHSPTQSHSRTSLTLTLTLTRTRTLTPTLTSTLTTTLTLTPTPTLTPTHLTTLQLFQHRAPTLLQPGRTVGRPRASSELLPIPLLHHRPEGNTRVLCLLNIQSRLSLYSVYVQCKTFANRHCTFLYCLTFSPSRRGTVLAGPPRGSRMTARRRTAHQRRSRSTHGCRSLTREAARSRRRCQVNRFYK